MAMVHVIFTIKKAKFVLLICLLPFLTTKGSRVFEKGIETKVSKKLCSFSINILQMDNKRMINMLLDSWEVCIKKNCDRGLDIFKPELAVFP